MQFGTCKPSDDDDDDDKAKGLYLRWVRGWGLGFGVWSLGFGVWGLGFRVRGLTLSARGLKSIFVCGGGVCAWAEEREGEESAGVVG